ncbi:hypothetical protein Leryth_005956 [Lithospermum erythrorhizon]|nr:hypothetical protein Leryth_005956 [Lithospermum erythrorhizon]
MDNSKYSQELDVAVRVVHMASTLCQKVQTGLLSKGSHHVQSKDDDSPVTIADWSIGVYKQQLESQVEPHRTRALTSVDCSSAWRQGKHWVLDPVDGTLGFVRGGQYAVALALMDNGEVVIGVLGCPNYHVRDWGHNHKQQSTSSLSSSEPSSFGEGCVMFTKKGSKEAWMQPLLQRDTKLDWVNSAKLIRVSSVDDPSLAVVCEPVERANTNHSYTAGLAHTVGLRKQPLRVYSMVKYAAIACGDAEIFMKFARAGYKEKIWDHAAGVLLVEEAGGVVTDAGGRPLDFSRGVYVEGLDRGIVACSGARCWYSISLCHSRDDNPEWKLMENLLKASIYL